MHHHASSGKHQHDTSSMPGHGFISRHVVCGYATSSELYKIMCSDINCMRWCHYACACMPFSALVQCQYWCLHTVPLLHWLYLPFAELRLCTRSLYMPLLQRFQWLAAFCAQPKKPQVHPDTVALTPFSSCCHLLPVAFTAEDHG